GAGLGRRAGQRGGARVRPRLAGPGARRRAHAVHARAGRARVARRARHPGPPGGAAGERRPAGRPARHRLLAGRVERLAGCLPGAAPGRGAYDRSPLLRAPASSPPPGLLATPPERRLSPMRLLSSLCVAVPLVAMLAPAAHATCGAEGCPFVRDAFGTTRGRYSFDLRYQGVTQDQLWNGTSSTTVDEILAGAERHGEVELFTRSQTWTAEGHAMLLPSLRLIAVLPYIDREHQHMLAHT